MKLIIGGSFQGKSSYAAERCGVSPMVADGSICTQQEILDCDIWDHLHLYIRNLLKQNISAKEIEMQIEILCQSNPFMCIVCNELGNGVVPMEAFDRLYRETVGRICCHIAKQAEQVIRIVCGIPIVLKE